MTSYEWALVGFVQVWGFLSFPTPLAKQAQNVSLSVNRAVGEIGSWDWNCILSEVNRAWSDAKTTLDGSTYTGKNVSLCKIKPIFWAVRDQLPHLLVHENCRHNNLLVNVQLSFCGVSLLSRRFIWYEFFSFGYIRKARYLINTF